MEPSYFIIIWVKQIFALRVSFVFFCGVGGDIIVLLFYGYTFQLLPFFGTFVKVRKEIDALKVVDNEK